MQLFNEMRDKIVHLASENASTLLTAGGVVGTVATAVLTGRAAVKAESLLETERFRMLAEQYGEEINERFELPRDERGPLPKMPEPPFSRKLIIAGPQYIPAVLTGSATITAIVMANRMSAQKAAALAAAYGMSQKHLEEYRAKVAEKLTGPKQHQIDDELAQERVSRTKGHEGIVVVEGEVLCFDQPTGRYFRSTMETIKQAVNATNAEILHHDHASASYFYEELELPPTTWTDEVGWNTDRLLELTYSTVLDPNNRPCIAIDFKTLPQADYIPKHY